ncbi:MAG: hypothetical protein EA384_06955 [Spirochaetaceae bacterium]|nr:MAG: hypothetical protein EA384_06955 [Spirochaetaceae bacterium]
MVFSAGNVLVLFIVVVILAIYRQLDRNNRSLEKVKRYAERVQSELDTLVDQKATAIKDMGIELEVHQKAAREVLKRIQTLEDGLSKRAEQIENIGNRIGDYDTALDELLRMTDRAQENITRIRDESEYIDTVGRRLKQSQAQMEQIQTRIPDLVTEFARHNEQQLENLEQSVLQHAEQRITDISETMESVDYRIHDFEESLAAVRAQSDNVTDAARADLERAVEQRQAELEQKADEARKSLERYAARFAKVEQEYEGRLEKIAARGEKMETAALEKLREHIRNRVQAVNEELSRSINEQHKQAEAHIKEVKLLLTSGVATMNTQQAEVDKLRGRIESELETLRNSLSTSSRELEQQVLTAVEGRIGEFEQAISYRVEKIEGVGQDMDALESGLREAMAGVEQRLNQEFEKFGAELLARHQQDRQEAAAAMDAVRAQMAELEQGITDLKQRAYENVSEKLQGFEDEFFDDLRDRSVTMERRLEEFQVDMRARLSDLEQRAVSERESMEVSHKDELRGRLAEYQSLFQSRFDTTLRKLESLEQDLKQRFAAWENDVAGFQQSVRAELNEVSSTVRTEFEQELTRQTGAFGSEVERFQKAVEARIQEIDTQTDEKLQDVGARIEATRSDLGVWQARVGQQLKGVEDDFGSQWSDFRSQVSAEIAGFADETRERRERIGSQITELENRLVAVRSELDDRIDEALAHFRTQYDESERRLAARAAEIQEQSDDASRELRNLVQQTREQFSGMQQKLLGRLQDESQVISANLDEIDKRQRQFVEQTRVFERADSLKVSLEQSIEELKNRLDRVEAMRSEIRDLDGQINKLRKAAAEASDKMGRFVAEKRRIDALEDDFRRLIGMSQSVETRLEQITAGDDELQAIQARLRSLEDMQRDVEESFERLEKKKEIVAVTTDGIDKNFRQLHDIEKRLGDVDERVNLVPQKLEDIATLINELSGNRKEADTAVRQLQTLEKTLGDVEQRMEQLSTAREWLARTETRLEEVGREAQEQVKLLGSLIKEGARDEKGSKGAPTLSARDTVVKLARQGWKVEEISRATKVSRGEVELILELAGNR